MSQIFEDVKNELINAIDNLKTVFDEWSFHAKNGLTVDEIDEMDFIPYVKDESNDSLIEYEEFERLIRKSLESDEGLKKSEFDWDQLQCNYDDVVEKYDLYYSLYSQIEDNLTGDQTVDTAEILSRDDLSEAILNYLEQENKIFSIQMQNETTYLLSSDLQKKLKEFL